jgi:hypothetical protein
MVNLIFVSAPYQKRNKPFEGSVSSASIALVSRVIRRILTEIYSLEKDGYDLECEIGCFLCPRAVDSHIQPFERSASPASSAVVLIIIRSILTEIPILEERGRVLESANSKCLHACVMFSQTTDSLFNLMPLASDSHNRKWIVSSLASSVQDKGPWKDMVQTIDVFTPTLTLPQSSHIATVFPW